MATPSYRKGRHPTVCYHLAMGKIKRFALRIGIGVLVGVSAGCAVALFVSLLDAATGYRVEHLRIVWALPIAGIVLGYVIQRWGDPVRAGNNLVIDSIHTDTPQIPRRVLPMVLVGSVATHLFGGSAGREGAAVQMSATIADAISHRLHLPRHMRSEILCAGVAAGFAAAFGAPWAGAVFGIEAMRAGRKRWRAVVPAVSAAIVADLTARMLSEHHLELPTVAHTPLDALLVVKLLILAAAVALVATAFIETTHRLKGFLARRIPSLPIRMMLGGLAVVGLWQLLGTPEYLGLGTPTILASFTDTDIVPWAFAIKLIFTAITLASGFLGGEVVPLFFIGATLGNALAGPLGIPLDLAAGVALAAMFAAASNTPLALSVLAVELMGWGILPSVLLVSMVAFVLTGDRSIYVSQTTVKPLRKVRRAQKNTQSP